MSDPVGAAMRISQRVADVFTKGVGDADVLKKGMGDADVLTKGFGDAFTKEMGGAFTKGVGDTNVHQVPFLPTGGHESSFGDVLTTALNGISTQQDRAADTLGAFLRGEPVELHQVMAATEEAQISLEMLIEVRNKFTEAYRSLTNMQG